MIHGRFRGLAPALALAAALLPIPVPAATADSYAISDFERVQKIDAHVHLHGTADAFMAQALHDGFRVLTINVDYPDFPPIDAQQADARSLVQRYPGRVAYATTISVQGFNQPGWAAAALARIDDSLAHGAVGVKIWKNIGMDLRDAAGRYVLPDDPRLDPVFAALEQRGVVLLGHQAEPLNCWLPLEKMTVKSDRTYFTVHPQYYMLLHPEVPSHEAQLAARDHMLAAHPRLRFDGVHLASLEWDVDEVARFLDRFPNAQVDLAARMVHLQHQAIAGRAKVRDFLIRYQDRILYGTDIAHGPDTTDADVAVEAHEAWLNDWRFLNTDLTLHSPDLDESFQGLALPRTVIDRIYRLNAQRLFPAAWKSP